MGSGLELPLSPFPNPQNIQIQVIHIRIGGETICACQIQTPAPPSTAAHSYKGCWHTEGTAVYQMRLSKVVKYSAPMDLKAPLWCGDTVWDDRNGFVDWHSGVSVLWHSSPALCVCQRISNCWGTPSSHHSEMLKPLLAPSSPDPAWLSASRPPWEASSTLLECWISYQN